MSTHQQSLSLIVRLTKYLSASVDELEALTLDDYGDAESNEAFHTFNSACSSLLIEASEFIAQARGED